MGNICNIFSNHNHKKKYENKLNISTPQFITEEIPIESNYRDLSNSQAIPTSNTNNYKKPSQTIVHHYNYNNNYNNNNNDNMINFLLVTDELYFY